MELTGEELHQMYVEERAGQKLESIPWSCLSGPAQQAWILLAARVNARDGM